MIELFRKLIWAAADQIDPEEQAEGPPPSTLRPFMNWALSGGWRVVWLLSLIHI